MRSWNLNLDEKLTPNFRLKEFIHWPAKTSMSDADKFLASKYAQGNFTYEHYVMYKAMANFLEHVRHVVHVDDVCNGHHYAIIITSGFRPKVGRSTEADPAAVSILFVRLTLLCTIRLWVN